MKLRDEDRLNPEDRRWIERVESELRPAPMDPVRAARFRRSVEERVTLRRRSAWHAGLVFAATTAGLAVLWLAQPEAPRPPSPENPVVRSSPAPETEPILYAYADPDAYGNTIEAEEYLPEDYLALSALLDVDA